MHSNKEKISSFKTINYMTNEISLQILRMKMKILKFVLGSLHQKKKNEIQNDLFSACKLENNPLFTTGMYLMAYRSCSL